MALGDYKNDVEACSRCSSCKWVPHNQVKSWRFAKNCPSMCRYNFHAYSGSGKLIMVNSIINGRSELTEGLAEIIYKCQMCGACDAACKVYRDDIDSTEILLELRAYCVEQGQLLVEHMAMIDALKQEDNVLGEPKAKRGEWAEGLTVKNINTEQAEVFFHTGCRFSYDPDLRDTVRGALRLMQSAGVDLGMAWGEESCCGGRAYELGYRGEAENYADDLVSRIKASGAKTVVTPCADCFSHLRYLYPRMGKELPEVLHTTQFLERLVNEGRLRMRDEVPLRVTYHDPCHLGRMSEPFTADWREDKLERPMNLKRAGTKGIYRLSAQPHRRHTRYAAGGDGTHPPVFLVLRGRRRRARRVPRFRRLDRRGEDRGSPVDGSRSPGDRVPVVREGLQGLRRRDRRRDRCLRPDRPGHALGRGARAGRGIGGDDICLKQPESNGPSFRTRPTRTWKKR